MRIGLSQVWAKTEPFQSILTHSELSGIVAQVIVKKAVAPGVRQKLLTALSCTDEVFCNWIGYLVSLHDIGKVEGQFQYRWPPMKERMDKAGLRPVLPEESIRHERTTWRCLRERIWRTAGHRSEAKFYADILAAHHQGKNGAEGEQQNSFWNSLQEELRHWLEHLMEDQVRAASSGCYLINAPDKGYTPIRETEKVRFDDLERSSYLSARTRLGEPTVRIALLPPERFRYFLGKSRRRDDGLFLSETSREEAREILKASVSVRARLLRHGNRETILGEGLLEGVEIYPGRQDKDGNMWCVQADGSRIVADRELGIFFEGGDACAGVV